MDAPVCLPILSYFNSALVGIRWFVMNPTSCFFEEEEDGEEGQEHDPEISDPICVLSCHFIPYFISALP